MFVSSTFALAVGVSFAAPAVPVTPTEIRVRLKRAQSAVVLTGFELQVAPAARFATTVSLRPSRPQRATVRATGRGTWDLTFDAQPTQHLIGDRLWVRGRALHLGREAAPFELELTAPGSGRIDVIAHLEVEKYLMGVLPAEMPIEWPLEALKAQAVAARSFALRLARERRRGPFDVEADITDQVYRFNADVHRHPGHLVKLRRAVTETDGQILLEPGGRVLKAFYSADCGCTTEDPRYVWGPSDAMQSVLDPTCGTREPIHWSRRLGRDRVRRVLTRALHLPAESGLDSFEIADRTPTGRVASVVAVLNVGGGSRRRVLNVAEFRRVFGPKRIRSANFSLDWSDRELRIVGTGVGHGVGMCQTGARAMAERGADYRAILKQYYPRAEFSPRERI